MVTNSKAITLAEWLESNPGCEVELEIAAELRRLHEINQNLTKENIKLWAWLSDTEQVLAIQLNRRKPNA